MLKNLSIEQFVIIDKLVLDFQTGLTVLTGETGAGKSILLGALGLMLGESSNAESIRQGSDAATIKAVFAPPSGHPVWSLLKDNGFVSDSTQEFSVKRVIYREKEQTEEITLNDKPIALELLKKIGNALGEIHGQFANQQLQDQNYQLSLLDLSGDFPPEVFENVATALHDVHRYTERLEKEGQFLSRNKHILPRVKKLVGTFKKMGMKEGFPAEAKAEYAKLLTAKETSEAFQSILSQLISSNGGIRMLRSAKLVLDRQENLETEKVQDLSRFLNAALDNANNSVDEVNRLLPQYEIDTKPLRHYGEILDTLDEIIKEAKISFEDLDAYYKDICIKYKRLQTGQETLKKLEGLLHEAKIYFLNLESSFVYFVRFYLICLLKMHLRLQDP